MQNTPQAFRGAGAPGVNFSEHSYDNHIGVHCQPSGYQPYTNPPYHPGPSPRSHHYANHQMQQQQNMPYRHHGGSYAPNQNQYGQNMNQDMFRNHHPGYPPTNNRNMPSKPWAENNSPDMMPPYGQVNHPQMMNNQQQMPMRSPPHATTNMNPVPTQGQQHYRQMQSPAHSPHSWSQAQIPSPGVMHSSRTTPSPLSAHVRSPGHSQPFSPPANMNMPPHGQPSENGQLSQGINSAGGSDPANPLHSLQKMVMLESDSKAMLPLMSDGSEPFPNQCGPPNYIPEEVGNESKDSTFSTYYNMDENRFESKPHMAGNDESSFTGVQQVTNCNFPLPSHPMSCEDVKSPPAIPSTSMSCIAEVLQSDASLLPPLMNSSPSSSSLCNSNLGLSEGTLKMGECPPHAESAPVFTDQTQAAVSTNSEQALESKPHSNWVELENNEVNPAPSMENQISNFDTSSISEADTSEDKNSNSAPDVQIKCENLALNPPASKSNDIPGSNLNDGSNSNSSSVDKPSSEGSCSLTLMNEVHCKKEDLESLDSHFEKKVNASVVNTENVKPDFDTHNADFNNAPLKSNKEDCQNSNIETPGPNHVKLEPIASEREEKDNSNIAQDEVQKPKQESSSVKQDARDSSPIEPKVVIHRITKCEDTDSWHVPEEDLVKGNSKEDKKHESKVPVVGPQIVIESPASSPQKKYGFRSTVECNSIITIKEDSSDEIEVIEVANQSKNPKKKKARTSTEESSSGNSPDKRRGRPVGSKNRIKTSSNVKKKRARKGGKRKKSDSGKQKLSEAPSKPKRAKVFNGPYVHIVGSKQKPSSISIVNVAQKEEEKVNKVPVKRSFAASTVNRIKKKPVGHLSTLSPTYDAFNRDKTWLCVFCHKGSHINGLGDLYGPYYIKDKHPESSKSPSASSSSKKRRKSDHEDSKSSKRSRQASGHSSVELTPKKTPEGENLDMKEVWIHEDCAIWCQSISLTGEEVQGLEDAVSEASENACCHCSFAGATLGCWGKSCKEQYHYSCAKIIGCQMDIEKFSLLCPKHQKKVSPDKQSSRSQ